METIAASVLSYTWTIPLLWITWDRNRMAKRLQEVEDRMTREESRNNGLHSEMKDHKRMLEKIVSTTTEIQTSIAYWKGKTEQV